MSVLYMQKESPLGLATQSAHPGKFIISLSFSLFGIPCLWCPFGQYLVDVEKENLRVEIVSGNVYHVQMPELFLEMYIMSKRLSLHL